MLIYQADSATAELTRKKDNYSGVLVTATATLASASLNLSCRCQRWCPSPGAHHSQAKSKRAQEAEALTAKQAEKARIAEEMWAVHSAAKL